MSNSSFLSSLLQPKPRPVTRKEGLVSRGGKLFRGRKIEKWADFLKQKEIKASLELLSGFNNEFGFNDERKLYGAVVKDNYLCINPNDVILFAVDDPLGQKVMHFARKFIKDLGKNNIVGEFIVDRTELAKLYQFDTKASSASDEDNYLEDDKWIIAYRDRVVKRAIELNASDIHLSLKNTLEIKFKKDGVFVGHNESLSYEKGLKFLNSLFGEFSEQDFNPTAKLSGGGFIRISSSGTAENRFMRYQQMPAQKVVDNQDSLDVVLRVFSSSKKTDNPSFSDLGFDNEAISVFDSVSRRNMGVVLMCGPTGSGKTTTLNSFYEAVYKNSGENKAIRTIENPPEGFVHGVFKSPLYAHGDFGGGDSEGESEAVSAFSSVLRMDPDCIGVGEIREKVFAKMVFEAAMTGHLVCSTIHASKWSEVYRRLIETIGLHSGIVTGKGIIQMIVSQRLMAKVCPHCAMPLDEFLETCNTYQNKQITDFVNVHCDETDKKKIRFIRGRVMNDCRHCEGLGVSGQQLIYDIFTPADNPECLHLIRKGEYDLAYDEWLKGRETGGKLKGYSMYRRAVDYARAGIICGSEVNYFLKES